MKISRKKKKIFKRLARVHFLLTVIAFGFYLTLSFFLGPKFLLSDLKGKFHVLADDIIVVTARVLDPPVQPVVTATSVCVTGSPRINLDWADDDNTVTWDIERDGSPMVTGLVVSSYADATVVDGTAYSYVVTAYGPMGPGSATSTAVVATTLDCDGVPTPVVQVITIEGENVLSSGALTIREQRPTFTGTSNIANAIIDILIHSDQIVSARIYANASGYWEWQSPVDLDSGQHTLSITATDPLDSNRISTDEIVFKILEDEDDEEDDDKDKDVVASVDRITPNIPFDFSLQSGMTTVYQGDVVAVSLRVLQLDARSQGASANVFYELISPDGITLTREESTIELLPYISDGTRLTVPLSTEPGERYRILATVVLGKNSVTREIFVTVLPLPILQLGGGSAVTLPQVVAFSGWIALLLLSLLLLWLLLFIREYWLYLHSWRHITEQQLIRLGFFGMRKGVSG